MALLSIPGQQAFTNVRASRISAWPDGRKDRTRLSGVAEVALEPTFSLEPGEAVFTVGSCFARNIEQRFAKLGFKVPACEFSLPAAERSSDTENDFLNKYPPHSILNEFRWALDPAASFPGSALVELKKNLWHDLQSAPNVKPAPLERVLERRRMIADLYRELPRCRVIIMTLGLVEAWFDEKNGHYLNGAPPFGIIQAEPERFRLDVLSPDEVLDALEQIYGLLEDFGHPDFRMLLTVSPVPLKTTFTGRDAITANSYSKSVLRVAAEIFSLRHERVDYFPSYEIVTHTQRASAFIQDNRHVTPQVVSVIVDRVVEAYCPGGAAEVAAHGRIRTGTAATEIQRALKAGDFPEAARLYAGLEPKDKFKRAGFSEFSYRYEYGRTLLRSGAIAEAQAQLARSVELQPSSAHAAYQLARALTRLQRPLEAEENFRRACTLAPHSVEMRLGLANQLSELGRHEEAEAEVQALLVQHPGHQPSLDALARIGARADRDRATSSSLDDTGKLAALR